MRNPNAIRTWALMAAGGLLVWALGGHAAISAAAAADMKPGLEVCYIYGLIRHIDEIAEMEKQKGCKPGKPLAELNSRVGLGKVLTSESDDGVIAKITGFIHLDKPGTYGFTFESNDGVRLEIEGKMILEDPGVHGDRYADIGHMEVAKPGWYPLSIMYFERKNTSTLRFFWSPPGTGGTMPLVPPEALAH